MKTKLGSEPAFPCHDSADPDLYLGLTKRELFAAMALIGIMTHHASVNMDEMSCKVRADWAIRVADATLAELEKETHE